MQQISLARNIQRVGNDPGGDYINEGIRVVYQQLDPMIEALREDGWSVLGKTELSIADTILEILKHSSA